MDTTEHALSRELKNKIFLRWSMEEMAFTVLPIVVIILVNFIYNSNIWGIFLLPDWSFASIILYGISILRLIQIKTEYQKSIAYRLYSGTSLYIVFCILSAVILVFALIRQQGGQTINPLILGFLQIFLFGFAGFSVYVATAAKEKFLDIPNRVHMSSKEIRSYLVYSLDATEQHLLSFNQVIHKNTEILQEGSEQNNDDDIIYLLHKIEKQLQQINPAFNTKP